MSSGYVLEARRAAPRIGELFAGYGGLGMGVQAVYGGEGVAWVSEVDKGANKILAHRFPDVPNHGDITAIDWADVEPVDILTGGSPCQDLSHAGRRAGMTEGTRSNLWVAMREAIAQLRPPMVVWENVGGAFSAAADSEVEPCAGCVGDGPGVHLRALGRVLGDLSSLGYDASWHALRAADVGAPHGRLRVFVVATDARDGAGHREWARAEPRQGGAATHLAMGWENTAKGPRPFARLLPSPRSSDTNGAGAHGDGGVDLRTAVSVLPTPTSRDWKDHTIRREPHRPDDADTLARALTDVPCALLPTPAAQEPGGTVEQYHARLAAADGRESTFTPLGMVTRWGDYAAAIARWEHILGRPAPAPTMTSSKGNPQLSPAFVEWMMGLPAGWITDVPGITRNEALKALGNGVVPQQAAEALRVMAGWAVAA